MRVFPVLILAMAPLAAFAASGDRAAQMVAQRFAAADGNHDGRLTLDEARAGMPRVAQHFEQIDASHKGYVTLDEIEAFLESQAGG